MDIMEVLVGPAHLAMGMSDAECGKDGNELKQEEDGTYEDPDLLSYIDKLCSQEDFITKVGWAWSLGSTRFQGMELSAPKIWVLPRPMGLKLCSCALCVSICVWSVCRHMYKCSCLCLSVCMPSYVCVSMCICAFLLAYNCFTMFCQLLLYNT